MLQVELKVNGNLIGVMNIVNRGAVVVDSPDEYLYEVKYFQVSPDNGIIDEGIHYINHHRKEGAETLVLKAFDEVLNPRPDKEC